MAIYNKKHQVMVIDEAYCDMEWVLSQLDQMSDKGLKYDSWGWDSDRIYIQITS